MIYLDCGHARDSLYFYQNGLQVIGVDFAEEKIKYLNENFTSENLSFLCNDIGQLENLGTFDYIAGSACML